MAWRLWPSRTAPELVRPVLRHLDDDTPPLRDVATALALWRLTTGNEPTSTILDDFLEQVTTT